MLSPVRFGTSQSKAHSIKEVTEASSPIIAETSFDEARLKKEMEEADFDSFVRTLCLNSHEAKVSTGSPVMEPYVETMLKSGESFPLVGPRTFAQHMVLGLHRRADIPIPFRLENGNFTLNESLRKGQPYLFNNALKATSADQLNKLDPLGFTPLHVAVYLGKLPQAKAILKEGANPFVEDANGRSALEHLARIGKAKELKELLANTSRSVMESAENQKKAHELQALAEKNHSFIEKKTKEFRRLSQDEKKLEMKRRLKQLSLTPEQDSENAAAAIAVVKAGLDINADIGSASGTTPLRKAIVAHSSEEMIYALLSLNPRLDIVDELLGEAVIHHAVLEGANITRLLLNAGSSVRQIAPTGDTPLHFATTFFSYGRHSLPVILQMQPEINRPNWQGKTPLHCLTYSAVANKRLEGELLSSFRRHYKEGCGLLLQAGADIHQVDNSGFSPLEIADRQGLTSLVDFMKSYGKNKHFSPVNSAPERGV